MTDIGEDMGVWVHVTEPGGAFLPLYGEARSGSTTIPLNKGWNLVGYPSISQNETVSSCFAGLPWDMVETFDIGNPYLISQVQGTDELEPGDGYWVHVTSACDWVVMA